MASTSIECDRFRQAKAMLTSGTPVAKVSETLGFSYPSHFAAWFARRSGLTPLRWVKAQNVARPAMESSLSLRLETGIANARLRYGRLVMEELVREIESRCVEVPNVVRHAKAWLRELPAAPSGA